MKYVWILLILAIGGAAAYYFVAGRSVAPSSMAENVVIRLGDDLATNQQLYRINPSKSQASFELMEKLYGSDKLVVGTTNDLAGDVIFDLSNPTNSKMGEIVVNARTIKTDNDQRNNAIANAILKSNRDKYEFIRLDSIELHDLPAVITEGQEFEFSILGQLEITGKINPAEFIARVTLEADSLTGYVETTVSRDDYDLTIPDVPFVANVDREVVLKADIIADLIQ